MSCTLSALIIMSQYQNLILWDFYCVAVSESDLIVSESDTIYRNLILSDTIWFYLILCDTVTLNFLYCRYCHRRETRNWVRRKLLNFKKEEKNEKPTCLSVMSERIVSTDVVEGIHIKFKTPPSPKNISFSSIRKHRCLLLILFMWNDKILLGIK